MAIRHSTRADSSFSAQGKTAWEADHTGDASDLSFVQSGIGASTRSTQEKLREIEVSIVDYGATDSADIVTAVGRIKTAYPNGCTIVIPETTNYWLLSSQISTPDGTPYTIKGRGVAGKIRMGFNGAAVSLGKLGRMERVYIDGQGATYASSQAVTITTGANENVSWREIVDCDFFDTGTYAVEFTANRAGFGSSITNCRMVPLTQSVAAIKLPTLGTTESNGNRRVVNCYSASNPLMDAADGVDTIISSCDGGVPKMNANASKVVIVGSRMVNYSGGPTWTIQGTLHSIVGNAFSLTAGTNSITFDAGLSNTKYVGNSSGSATIADSAPGSSVGNEIYYGQQTYTTAWTGSSSNPAIGNGSISSVYRRSGDIFHYDIEVVMGNLTTFGTGYWEFTTGLTAHRNGGGTWDALDSGTAFYGGVAKAEVNTNKCVLVSSGAGNYVTSAIPHTWATSDTLSIKGWAFVK